MRGMNLTIPSFFEVPLEGEEFYTPDPHESDMKSDILVRSDQYARPSHDSASPTNLGNNRERRRKILQNVGTLHEPYNCCTGDVLTPPFHSPGSFLPNKLHVLVIERLGPNATNIQDNERVVNAMPSGSDQKCFHDQDGQLRSY